MAPPAPGADRRYYLIGGVALLGAGYLLYRRRQASAAAAASTAAAPIAVPSQSADSGQQLNDIYQALQSLQGPASTPAEPTSTDLGAGEKVRGQGVGPSSPSTVYQDVQATSGGTYRYVPSPQSLRQLVKANVPIFFQPVPGVFQPYTANQLKKNPITGTPTYIKVA